MVGAALARLSPAEREVLLAHEVAGTGTAELAAKRNTSPGAIAAQLNRTRAKLRVEYLLAERRHQPADGPVPAGAVRAVRRGSASATRTGHRRAPARLRHLPAAEHGAVRTAAPSTKTTKPGSWSRSMPTWSTARQQAGLAARAGFTATELTVIATAISEVARNIVKFAQRGEIVVGWSTRRAAGGVRRRPRLGPGHPGPGRGAP